MSLELSNSLKLAIETKYQERMAECPAIRSEADAWMVSQDDAHVICMKFLYAFMHPSDLLSYGVETIASYVKSTLKMREQVAYARTVPVELFLSYVLSVRVNNENLDESRDWMFEQLVTRVQGKSMTEAALEVNYWCYEKATYIPTDGRTIAPFGMCKRAQGRCGEESTLAVSALRSVGIPARQCYVPRWAHCDDNHAWVEVWTDGEWHYMGACEPEPVLDRGWFTAAASKAMLVHAKAYSHFLNGEIVAAQTPLTSLINSTRTYGNCVTVKVMVLDHGIPAAGIPVSFQLINYSELFELYREETNDQGCASFLTGAGDLYICAVKDGCFAGKRVDLREGTELILELSEGYEPASLEAVYEECFDLNPPLESLTKADSSAAKDEHQRRLRRCEEIRGAYEAGFRTESGISEKWDGYFRNAKGNHGEIQRFYEMEAYSIEEKEMLLDELREKDFADTTAEILASFLDTAREYRGSVSDETWKKYILAARISNEMLTDERKYAAAYLKAYPIAAAEGAAVWKSVQEFQMLPDYRVSNCTARADLCLRYAMCTENSAPVVFVQICRALGIPSRLNPVTGEPEFAKEAENELIWYAVRTKAAASQETVALTLINTASEPLEYMHHFTIGQLEGDRFKTLWYWDMKVTDQTVIHVQPGVYRLITTVRQIDGGVSARVRTFPVKGDCEVKLELREDGTKKRLKYVPVPDGMVQLLDAKTGEVGSQVSLHALGEGRKTIFLLCEPGKEPTEHLFQEILECQEAYCKENYRVIVALTSAEGIRNETFRRVAESPIDTVTVLCTDDIYIYKLHEVFHVGDERLPFAAAITPNHKGLFAFANYNIRTAWILMKLFQNAE